MSLPEFSIRRPVTVSMACFIAMLLGAIAFVEIPVDLMPAIEYPTLSVNVGYPGVAPQEMETLVARPLEQALAAAPGVEEITSSASEGRASVRVRFGYNVDLDEAANELRTRLDRRRDELPEDIEPPTLYKYDVSQYPIMFLTISSDTMDAKQLRHFAEKNIQYRVERAPGVAAININGGLRRQIHVNLELEKLRALNLSVAEVVQKLREENLNRPVGPVHEGRYEVLVRTEGEFNDLEDILNVPVVTRAGVKVYVRDIASVDDSHEDIRYMVSVNGKPAVRMFVYKQSDANTVEVSDAVKAEIARINRDYQTVQVQLLRDAADFIKAAIANVQDATIVGGGLALFVLLFFLRSVSSTLIIGVAIPVSVVSTFALMYFNGFTLNTVSFGGLALGVGMLVDNAIVVLENIFRHREEGKSRREAAIIGSREVAMAITASTLTTIAVFVPVLFIEGQAGQTFGQLAWVVSFALFCSLAVAVTIVPMLSAKFLRRQDGDKRSRGLTGWIGRVLDGMSAAYGDLLGWALDHRIVVVGLAATLFAGAVYVWPLIGVELQPEVDEGQIRVSVTLEPGTRVEVTDQVVKRIEAIVREYAPEVETIMSEAGSNSSWRAEGGHEGDLRINLVPQEERERTAAQVAAALREHMQFQPGMIIQTRIDSDIGRRGGFDDGDRLSIEIRGHDPDILNSLTEQVVEQVRAVEGVASAQMSRQPGMPEVVVRVDREKANSMGLDVAQVASTLETAIGGSRASMYRQEGDEYDILVRLREQDRLEVDQLGQVSLRLPDGGTIPASAVVSLQRREGPFEITRADQQRIQVVSGVIEDRDLGSVVEDVRMRLDSMAWPPDYEYQFGGEYEEQQRAFRQLTLAAILAFGLVYMVMAAQFESIRDPFIILFSVPLAFVGVAASLLLTETTFNMQGFLGIIVLVGIVVNNAIVLVDYTNLLRREQGYRLREAIQTAGVRRLRPILMTTITTVLGLTPMALGLGEGGELQAPMARVVIGGLTTSTLITLVFIPVVYSVLEQWGVGVSRRHASADASDLQPAPSSGD